MNWKVFCIKPELSQSHPRIPKACRTLLNIDVYSSHMSPHSQRPDIAQRSQTSTNSFDAITDLFIMIYAAGKTYKFTCYSGAGPSGVPTIKCWINESLLYLRLCGLVCVSEEEALLAPGLQVCDTVPEWLRLQVLQGDPPGRNTGCGSSSGTPGRYVCKDGVSPA